jgi:hypothetical protein
VNYNLATQTIVASFNVSSVTRTGLGSFTVSYSTAMPSASYSATMATNYADNGGGYDSTGSLYNFATGSIKAAVGYPSALRDNYFTGITIFA